MGILSGAMPRTTADAETKIKSKNGVYKAQFLGMTPEYEWVSPFGDLCRLCKGQRRGRNGEGDCIACHGSGKRTELHTKLQYKLENGELEEEEVNFKLAPAGQSQDGRVLSPTTLFIRLRAFSGNRNATPADLDAWYSSLQKPIRIPCTVIIGDNKAGTASKIEAVQLRTLQSQQQVPPASPPPPAPVSDVAPHGSYAGDSFDDNDLPF